MLRKLLALLHGSATTMELLDIGANVGIYALAFARFPFGRVVVHAFEAQRTLCEMLSQTIALNRLDNIRCHHKAVSSESGRTILMPSPDYDTRANFGAVELEPGARSDFDGRHIPGATESVETICIDDLALANVRLMKIDVEGMEHKVLAGARDTVERCRPIVFVEFKKADLAALKSFLRTTRYRAYYVQRPNLLCLPAESERFTLYGATPADL